VAKEKKSKPKQKQLPTMEDRQIQELQDKAIEYAQVRDERMALSKQEGELKTDLLKLMHKHKKTEYTYNGVTVLLVMEEETVKVKVKPKDVDADDQDVEEMAAAG